MAKPAALCFLAVGMALGWTGCNTTQIAFEDRAADAATLEKSVAAIHDSTIGVFDTVNTDLLPYRVKAESRGDAFDPNRLYVLHPDDIAVWDKLLKAVDLYCTGLSKLAGNSPATDFTTSAEALGGSIKALGTLEKMKTTATESDCATAVIALGDLVIRYQANADLHKIVGEAEPHFDAVIDGLVDTLGFSGTPPKPQAHGILSAYDLTFGSYNLNAEKEFQDNQIAGFAGMTPAEREGAILDYLSWKKADADHSAEDQKISALVAALVKAKAAHAALAGASPPDLKSAFAQLEAAVKAVQQIRQKM